MNGKVEVEEVYIGELSKFIWSYIKIFGIYFKNKVELLNGFKLEKRMIRYLFYILLVLLVVMIRVNICWGFFIYYVFLVMLYVLVY